MPSHKPALFNEGKLNEWAKERKLQPFKVKQIFFEMYKNQNIERDAMTTLSKDLKSELQFFLLTPMLKRGLGKKKMEPIMQSEMWYLWVWESHFSIMII